jgi:hypothetical protein
MLARVVRHVRQRPRFRRQFLTALPLVAWFYVCWIAGEAAGLLSAP